MRYPEMILFDYGQTLIREMCFDGVAGSRALMAYAVENRYGLTPEQVNAEAEEINRELGRNVPGMRHRLLQETPQTGFQRYLYESLGIRLALAPEEAECIFWDAAAPPEPTPGIQALLAELSRRHIRTGVISNMGYSGRALSRRLAACLPEHAFEFVLASSDYVFRKPNPRLFRLGLTLARLPAEAVWYCGDSLKCDVAGAAAVGMQPVWYTSCVLDRTEQDDTPRIEISHWNQLLQLLDHLKQNENG